MNIVQPKSAIRRFFCKHDVVHIIRYHRNCVTPDMVKKLLYIDRLKVHNFVQCCKCGEILYTNQFEGEKLFEQRDVE